MPQNGVQPAILDHASGWAGIAFGMDLANLELSERTRVFDAGTAMRDDVPL
jgi:hypothetical protein